MPTIDLDGYPARWIVEMIARDGDAREFYHSRQWQRLRARVLKKSHWQCYGCAHKSPPVLTTRANAKALTVHHVLELRIRPDLALDEKNLVVLCPSCHWDIHHHGRAVQNPERW